MRKTAIIAVIASLAASTPALAGDIAGTVYDAGGAPVAGVQVTIAELGLEAVTLADGTYRFADLPSGEHFIIARADGAAAQRIPVNLASNGDAGDDATRNIFLMSRMAMRQVTGVDAGSVPAQEAFAEALTLADHMITEGTAQGEIAWSWRDLDG